MFLETLYKMPNYARNVTGRDYVRMLVRMRDNFTCADCKKRRTPKWAKYIGKRLYDIHHLNGLCGKKSHGYDRLEDMDGLITLCHRCHFNRPEHRCKSNAYSESKSLIKLT